MNLEATKTWWREDSILREILPSINNSRSRDDQVERCNDLCSALDTAWTEYSEYRRKYGQLTEPEKKGRSDSQAIKELILRGLGNQNLEALFHGDSIRYLARLSPHVMDQNILRNRMSDRQEIPSDLRKEASKVHQKFESEFYSYSDSPNPSDLSAPGKKLAELLYIVRCNIKHSEKTPNGPDKGKLERDRNVSKVAADLIDELFDFMFERPSHRLAAYGSLVPGGANAQQLEGLEGHWEEGKVEGELFVRDGFQFFRWEYPGNQISVKLFFSSELQSRFTLLDKFEGPRYKRILVPVDLASGPCVCNIYEVQQQNL